MVWIKWKFVKRRTCLEGMIFVCFNSNESWKKKKLSLSNKCGASGWQNQFSFDELKQTKIIPKIIPNDNFRLIQIIFFVSSATYK